MASGSFWPNTSREEWRQDSADHTVWFRGIKLTIENGDQIIMVMCCGDMLYIDIFRQLYNLWGCLKIGHWPLVYGHLKRENAGISQGISEGTWPTICRGLSHDLDVFHSIPLPHGLENECFPFQRAQNCRYTPAVKHGLLENPPLICDFPTKAFIDRGFFNCHVWVNLHVKNPGNVNID